MFGKHLFTRPARDLATKPTSQSRPGPSGRRLFKQPLAFLQKVQDVKSFFHRSGSQEEVKDARLQEAASPELSFRELTYSYQDFDGITQDDPQHQVPNSGSPDISILSPVQAEEEASASSTPSTTFSVAASPGLATPKSVSTTPTSTLPSSLHTFEPHPDLLTVNQRIAELEAIAKQVEQEHADYVKEAQEMDATLTSLEKGVDSAIEAIKSVNRKTALEAEECMKLEYMWLDERHAISRAEDDLFRAKNEYEEGQKKYADLQVRYENLQQERQRRRIGMDDAGPLPPDEPWLEVLSTAVAPNLLIGIAFGIGHTIGPILSSVF